MRYKGIKIPTYEEALNDMELNKLNEDMQLSNNLVVQVREVNIIVCTKDEAENIQKMDGVNGINHKIEEVVKDYVDNVMEGALTMIGSVQDMQDKVNDDPDKQLKNMYELDKPEMEVTPDAAMPIGDIEKQDCSVVIEAPDTPKKELEASDLSFVTTDENPFEELPEPEEKVEDPFESTQLTDEEIEKINAVAENVVENNSNLKMLKDLPSNNGVEERNPEDITEEGESKVMNVSIDPNTGEHKILGTPDEFEESINESFEDMYNRISAGDIEFSEKKEIDEEESKRILEMDKSQLLTTVDDKALENMSEKTILELIQLANRKISGEKFSVYNALPEEIKKLIDKYALESGMSVADRRFRDMKHTLADLLMDDFVANIDMERVKHDFNHELESMFNKASEELGEEIIGYSEEKIRKYKEAADQMEDTEKKEKLLKVLDRIQEAYDLSELKEFAKKCKIKKFDLEKPNKYYDSYHRKYANSNYNIYSIDMARPILYRNLNAGKDEEYRDIDINAFFIAFCKQTRNMKAEDVLDHAYMYYVIYNIVLADLNKSEKTKQVSETFLDNVKEVIGNLRNRNTSVL